jgi:Bacterial regulatory helix-turn-helix proteins, AraC family
MDEIGPLLRRQRFEPSAPLTYLHTSLQAGWSGAVLAHTLTNRVGHFEGCWSSLMVDCVLSAPHGFFDVDVAGNRTMVTNPVRITPPGEVRRGAWERPLESVGLFIGLEAIERALGTPYARSGIASRTTPRNKDPLTEHLLRALLADVVDGSRDGAVLGETIIAALLHHLQNAPSTPKSGRYSGLSRRQLGIARDIIHANLNRRVQLAQIADALGLSIRQLCRAFRVSTGFTPYQYVLQCRSTLPNP